MFASGVCAEETDKRRVNIGQLPVEKKCCSEFVFRTWLKKINHCSLKGPLILFVLTVRQTSVCYVGFVARSDEE